MKKIIYAIILAFLMNLTLVYPASDKIIKVTFTINNKNHIELEKFEVREGQYKNFVESPSTYSLQIKNEKGNLTEKTNFAPAFFMLSKENKLIKTNETRISREFLYKGDKWRFLEIYKEDKLLYQADVEEKFCEETKLCRIWIKIMFYIAPIAIILIFIITMFIKKRRENVF